MSQGVREAGFIHPKPIIELRWVKCRGLERQVKTCGSIDTWLLEEGTCIMNMVCEVGSQTNRDNAGD